MDTPPSLSQRISPSTVSQLRGKEIGKASNTISNEAEIDLEAEGI